jgi:hypothetical protein
MFALFAQERYNGYVPTLRSTMNFVDAVKLEYPDKEVLTRPELFNVAEKYSLRKGFSKFMTTESNKIRRGLYKINPGYVDTSTITNSKPKPQLISKPQIQNKQPEINHINEMRLIPDSDPEFVSFGDYNLIKKIIKSKSFFPIYISGESGNGKTKMVYQACASTSSELIRANITASTDEDDLIGGYRLVNGETVWQNGPVVEAMIRGAVILLDEINLASTRIMCLQPILEGNPIYIKKTNTLVKPAHGFNVIATANTKGKSSEDGRYIGSNTLNEALLDRFPINIEHDYPSQNVEKNILINVLETLNQKTDENLVFVDNLVKWAKGIRDTFSAGGVDEIITTRRLIHIIRFNAISGATRIKSVRYCISRFDEDTKKSFLSLYQKIDETVSIDSNSPENEFEDTVSV